MKKQKKIKLSKFKIARIDNLEVKGGVDTNACGTIACMTNDSCHTVIDTTCKTTIGTRTGDSLK